jgi:hypothetical protein
VNFIHRLQNELIESNRVLTERLERTQEFHTHLLSSKFHNRDDERQDWIAVADVRRWLNYIQDGNN